MARVYGRYSPDINISDGLLRGIVQPGLVSVLHSLAKVSVGILQHFDQEVLRMWTLYVRKDEFATCILQ